MRIDSIKLYQFRNLEDGVVKFSPGVTLIVGRNGQGKTSLIESIALLSTAKSFRSSKAAELSRWGTEESSAFARINRQSVDEEIGVVIKGARRQFYRNGAKLASVAEALGLLTTVVFTPDMLSMVKGAPALRRSFIDKHVIDLNPTAYDQFSSYAAALKNKNVIIRSGESSEKLLDPWNLIMAREGARIRRLRREFINRLTPAADSEFREFAPSDGQLEMRLEGDSGEDEEDILKAIRAGIRRELSARSAIIGPHRDDLLISIGGVDARAFASQGQTRCVVLALLTGAISVIEEDSGDSPVVLLDDVNSELDSERSASFFNLLLNKKRQILVTGTDASLSALNLPSDVTRAELEQGRLRTT